MAYLTLEDGTIFRGEAFGPAGDITGEVVFNTGMTGYQEVLTDPSYCGQIVTLTYPIIGNYGINAQEAESGKVQVKAFVVREFCEAPSGWRCEKGIQEYLEENGVTCLYGIDTRQLTRLLREKGTMKGIITSAAPSAAQTEQMKKHTPGNTVQLVTCKKPYAINEGGTRKVAVLDFGLKRNILRSLAVRNCALTVFPAHTPPEEILGGGFDGLMLTNGPGDPQDNGEIIENLKRLVGALPIFGICLGHQLTALAMGGDTEKLKYGHRGANHPVKDLQKNRVYITSQNHGYAVKNRTLPDCAVISHRSMNDQTIEGVRYVGIPMFTVQFHPEASPGPQDTGYLFDEFIQLMDYERRKHDSEAI